MRAVNVTNIESAAELEAASPVNYDQEVGVGCCDFYCFHASRKAIVAFWTELIAMAFFVYVGCGSASQVTTPIPLQIALTFGLAITVCVYATAHRSGGHINPAVTWALVLSGDCNWWDGILIMMGQLLGAVCGTALLAMTVYDSKNKDLGSNQVAEGYDSFNAFTGEIFMTFMLLLVIYETAIHNKSIARLNRDSRPILAPIPIGLAVFCAHSVLIPVDGCSINPARSLGVAIVATFRKNKGDTDYWKDMYIFIIGPFAGATLAAIYSRSVRIAGYFTSGSKQNQGLRRNSVFGDDLTKLQVDSEIEDHDVEEPAPTKGKEDGGTETKADDANLQLQENLSE